MVAWLAVFFAFLSASHASTAEPAPPNQTTVQRDPNTILVLFGTRHGNRNPEKFVDVPNRDWGQEGALELTSIGKRQAYGLGRELRSYFGDYIHRNYVPAQAKFYTSSANRCQMTLQSALAGIFNPQGWADWNKESFDSWSPVPYTIDDPLLRMYSVDGCIASDSAWAPISDDTLPSLKELEDRSQNLLNYMHEKDGRDPTISNAGDIADNIINMDFYNATYPDWLASPTLAGYTASSIKKAYLSFAEKHMNECASFQPCREMMGGLWADHIMKALDSASSGSSKIRLIGYASHTEVTLSVMKILGIQKSELTTSAGFAVELRNTSSSPHVRILQHDPNPIDDHVIYQARLVAELSSKSDSNGWMPLSALKEYVANASFSDWKSQCGIDLCTSQAASQTTSTTQSSIATSSCTSTDVLSSLECSQLIDTLGCSHAHTQSMCSRTCCGAGTVLTPVAAYSTQSLSIAQIGSAASIISSVPMQYTYYPDGSLLGNVYVYGKK